MLILEITYLIDQRSSSHDYVREVAGITVGGAGHITIIPEALSMLILEITYLIDQRNSSHDYVCQRGGWHNCRRGEGHWSHNSEIS